MALKTINKTVLVPYTARQMFELVAAAESYPEFLPGCRSVEIHEQNAQRVVGTVELAKGKLKKSFTTENLLFHFERIEIRLVKGPFHHLEGHWRFEPLGDEGCKVCLDLEFEFSSKLLAMSVAPVFHEVANKLVGAFVKRARQLYDGT
ncbi:MAG: type II toxin-antitoxin system RatA family toxin [Gammaproteobacteria bacterium]|nr:type II toxin-antitoxin system RatA family toxin [Gammaproteobacteria bacterium]